jgi:GNAT superfamily N-acetyltransferase
VIALAAIDQHEAAARAYAENVILKDGSTLLIRALRSSDRPLIAAFFLSLSPQSIRYRVFASKSALSETELTYLIELDFVSHVGLVAVIVEGEKERVLGVGRFCRVPLAHSGAAPASAELALTVLDEAQGHGIGTLLLEHLARIAREAGIVELEADVMIGNTKMMQVFSDSGFVMHKSLDEGIFHVRFPTSATPIFLQASHARELTATASHHTSHLH